LHDDGPSVSRAAELADAVERLHQAKVTSDVPKESFDLPFMSELAWAVDRALDGDACGGPLGVPLSRLVSNNRLLIESWRRQIIAVQRKARDIGDAEFVLTHAGPGQDNVLIDREGRLRLLDWGALMWAPPERDYRSLRNTGIAVRGRSEIERFFLLWWVLSEVAEDVDRFVQPHIGDDAAVPRRRQPTQTPWLVRRD